MSISRRLFLLNTSASAAAGMTISAAAAVPDNGSAEHPWKDENPALIEAWEQYRKAEADYLEAEDALEWLADEWKHLWPLAPEELLGAANAHRHDLLGRAERDILGRPLMRETAVLTKRLTAQYRTENALQCFMVTTSARIRDDISFLTKNTPAGRTEKALARKRAAKAKRLRELRHQLPLARQYEAETAQIREAAGVEAAKSLVQATREQMEALAHRVSMERPTTLYGVRLQADVVIFTLEQVGITERSPGFFGEAMRLACNLMDATVHLSRGHYLDGGAV